MTSPEWRSYVERFYAWDKARQDEAWAKLTSEEREAFMVAREELRGSRSRSAVSTPGRTLQRQALVRAWLLLGLCGLSFFGALVCWALFPRPLAWKVGVVICLVLAAVCAWFAAKQLWLANKRPGAPRPAWLVALQRPTTLALVALCGLGLFGAFFSHLKASGHEGRAAALQGIADDFRGLRRVPVPEIDPRDPYWQYRKDAGKVPPGAIEKYKQDGQRIADYEAQADRELQIATAWRIGSLACLIAAVATGILVLKRVVV